MRKRHFRSRLLSSLLTLLMVGCSAIPELLSGTNQTTPLLPASTAAALTLEVRFKGTSLFASTPTATDTIKPTNTSVPTGTPATTSTNTPQFTALPSLTAFSTNLGYGPKDFPPEVNPLTGKVVEEPEILNRRPMVIKITNFPRSVRPQWGLTAADHIYEYYLEDGLTRFVAIFYGQDASRVGPIRSARPFDAHIVHMYRGIFAFAYADSRVREFLRDTGLDKELIYELPDNCPPLCRIGPKNAYNTLFADTQLLSSYASELGIDNVRQNLHGLRFESKTLIAFGGGEASRIAIRYSRNSHNYWEYDPASRQYYRYQEDGAHDRGEESYQPLFDSLTGEQVSADNIIVLLVPTPYFYQSNSTEIYDIALKGKGDAYAMRDGKVFQIKWERPAPDTMILLQMPNGTPYPLKPGNVWFEVLGQSSTHIATVDKIWQFFFSVP